MQIYLRNNPKQQLCLPAWTRLDQETRLFHSIQLDDPESVRGSETISIGKYAVIDWIITRVIIQHVEK